MKHLIVFNLKRHFLNKTSLLTNAIIALLIIMAFFIDVFIKVESHQVVYIDKNCPINLNDLLALNSNINYEILNKEDDNNIVLKYDDHYVLTSKNKISENIVSLVDNDLTKLVLNNYQQESQLLDYQLEVKDGSSDFNLITYIITAVYIMIISLSFLLANEITSEKASHVLEMLLTNISVKQHLLAKIIGSYLDILVQSGLLAFDCILGYLLRYSYDKTRGLNKVIAILSENQIDSEIEMIDIKSLVAIFLICTSCLVLIQIIILFITSCFNNAQQVASLNTLLYVIMLIIYIVCLNGVDQKSLMMENTKIISLLPLCNIVLMNCRLVIQQVSYLEILITVLLNIISCVVIIETMSKRYKENILNFHL